MLTLKCLISRRRILRPLPHPRICAAGPADDRELGGLARAPRVPGRSPRLGQGASVPEEPLGAPGAGTPGGLAGPSAGWKVRELKRQFGGGGDNASCVPSARQGPAPRLG